MKINEEEYCFKEMNIRTFLKFSWIKLILSVMILALLLLMLLGLGFAFDAPPHPITLPVFYTIGWPISILSWLSDAIDDESILFTILAIVILGLQLLYTYLLSCILIYLFGKLVRKIICK